MARHVRWLRLVVVAFTMLPAPLSASASPTLGMAPISTQSGRVGGITAGAGPVMTGRVNVYMLWYGTFPAWSQTESIVEYFVANWGASHSYAVLRNYTGSNGRVAPQLALAKVSLDSGSRGTNLVNADIRTLVANAIQNNTFPADSNGIYVVLVGRGVSVNSGSGGTLCGTYCGWHTSTNVNGVDIKFVLDGAGDCDTCETWDTPNNDLYADMMVNTLAHEIAETVTDPDLNAWGSGAANDEVGDKCNFNFSERHNLANFIPATAKIGMNYYTIQELWLPTGGGACSSGYAPPAAVIWQQGDGGAISAWKMTDQNTVGSYLYYNDIPLGQKVLGVGDFSNGIDPQVLTTPLFGGGPVTMWTLHGDGTSTSAQMFSNLAQGWRIAGTGDFNGDGYSDILFSNPTLGSTEVDLMQGTTVLKEQIFGSFLPWLPQGAADFNGDGLTDMFWVDNADQLYGIWLSSVSPGVAGVSFTVWGQANISSSYLGHPTNGLLGVADLNGDSRADVLYNPANWPGLSNGVLMADFIRSPFEQNDRFVANSILPDSPSFSGLVDVNRDGTTDFFLQTSTGVRFFTMGDWKSNPQVFGPLPDSDPYTDFEVAASGSPLGDAGWMVVGTGTFREN